MSAVSGLMLVATVAVVGTIETTRAQSAAPHFEVASVRIHTSNERVRFRVRAIPDAGRLTLTGMGVQEVIQSAYGLQSFELVTNGSPILTQRIDVVAKAPTPATVAEMQQMLRPLLEERFKLAVHRETREIDALLLVRANTTRLGPKIRPTALSCAGVGTTNLFAIDPQAEPNAKDRCGVMPTDGPGRIVANGIDMRALAGELGPSQGRPVVDKTGLEGRYDIDLTYTPEIFSAAALQRRGTTAPPNVDPNGPPLATALVDQLGLKLEGKRAPIEVVVIDRIETLIED
ncbi:MAG TPA: TIGR03435 family protein [Vicinamibacterales bacterium]